MSVVNKTAWPPIEELAAQVRAGATSAISLVERALQTIDASDDYNAVIAATAERALQRAASIDELVRQGKEAGRLAGVPFILKDNILAFGADSTAGSNMLRGFESPYQATVVLRLEAEGAICVAKANLDAFGHGGSTQNSDFGVTKNPNDMTRVAGGSSGGSAASVVLGMVPFALGTDTGGSIRQPASYTGSVGYKPTYGRVSRWGVVAMASSTDVVGPITRSVADAALVLDVIAAQDPLDSTTIMRNDDSLLAKTSLKNKKIGLVTEYMTKDVDPAVRETVQKALDAAAKAGAEVVEVSLPSLELAVAVYYILVPAELSSNLSRYDGQRYQYSKQASTLERTYTTSRGHGFGLEAKRRIMIGTYVLSHGYYDAYYKKAQVLRTKLIREFEQAFKTVDFLAGPVAPVVAPKIGSSSNKPLQEYLEDAMTVGASLTGSPAISIPAGTAHDMPVGLQLIAPFGRDAQILSAAQALEEIL